MSYKVALIADNHFIFDKEDVYVNGTYTQQYLQRFTSNFDELVVIARCRDRVAEDDITKLRTSGGKGVSFVKIEDFYGTRDYLAKRNKIKNVMNKALSDVDAIFVRMPCILTTISIECAKKNRIPIMLDVAADPDTIYRSSKATISELLISKYMKYMCRKACMDSNGVSYVTKNVLEQKYPCYSMVHGESTDYFNAAISNADISNDFYFHNRDYSCVGNPIRLLHVSNNICNNSSKGHIECLQITKKLVDHGYDVRMMFLGDGEGRKELENISKSLGIEEQIVFMGRIADRSQYRNIMLNNDFFIFPSHSEGLPRSVLEAMSTGMVCIASNTDGIPEVINKEDIFAYYDVDGFVERIEQYIANRTLRERTSEENYTVALNYSNDNLRKAYNEYYSKVRSLIDYKRGI